MSPVTILKRQDVDAGATAGELGCLLVGTAYALSFEPPAPTMPTPREDSQDEKPPLKSGKTQNNPGTTAVRQRGRGAPAVLFRKRKDAWIDLMRRELMDLKVHSRRDAELARLTHAKLRYRIGVLQQRNACLTMELAQSAELSSVPTVDNDGADDGADDGDVVDNINTDAYDGGALLPTGEVEVAPITTRGNIYTLQSVLATTLKAFAPAHTSSDDIRQIETTNRHESQDLEGLPPVPRRKRRRTRKRKRTRRRPGQAKKSRPRHSPVTPPHRYARVRHQAAKEFQAVFTVFHSKPAGCHPVSGFDSIWDRTATKRTRFSTCYVANEGILLRPTKAEDQNLRELVTSRTYP